MGRMRAMGGMGCKIHCVVASPINRQIGTGERFSRSNARRCLNRDKFGERGLRLRRAYKRCHGNSQRLKKLTIHLLPPFPLRPCTPVAHAPNKSDAKAIAQRSYKKNYQTNIRESMLVKLCVLSRNNNPLHIKEIKAGVRMPITCDRSSFE